MIPIHNHTHFSGDGLPNSKEIVGRIKELNFGGCGCTDHDLVAGHHEFFTAFSKEKLNPILGIETYQTLGARQTNHGFRRDPQSKNKADNFHLILLAMNNTGLRNLWAMNTEAHKSGYYYVGRVDWDLLQRFNEGIICTSACSLGVIQQGLDNNSWAEDVETNTLNYLDIFGDRFYLELGTYGADWQKDINLETVNLARRFSIPVVYGNDAHYLRPENYELHETMILTQPGRQGKLTDTLWGGNPSHLPDLYIMDEADVRSHLDYLGKSVIDEAISNSDTISEQCNVTFPDRKLRIPVFVPDKKWKTSREMLFDLVVEGYETLVGTVDNEAEYMARIQKELKVIYDANLVDYLLIVRDYVMYAKRKGYLVGPGRGSIGGSLVAYLLGITLIDPIEYGLIFERFYNAGREKSLPDIDIDFPKQFRDGVKEYISKRYGSEYVADITNLLTYQGRSAVNKIGKVMGKPGKDLAEIGKLIDSAVEAGLQPDWDRIYNKNPQKIDEWRTKEPELMKYAESMYDHNFSFGIHASGVLVADEPLACNFPLRWVAKEKKMVTQWDMHVADEMGYMKMDLLALRNLDTLMEVNNLLKDQGIKPIDYYSLHKQTFPDEMWQLLDRGLTVGIFQIEEGFGAKELAKEIRPRSIEELTILISLNRPGPDSDSFIKRKNGEFFSYTHQLLEPILNTTYGEFVFQEQIINFFTEIGYTLSEADTIRKSMGKKLREEMEAEEERYLERACKYMPRSIAEIIWNSINKFAKYGFNKSHGVGYALITLWTLYAKWAYPKEFILAGVRTAPDHASRYINEARRLGISVLRPDISHSMAETTFEDGGIRYGFSDVKGIGKGAANWFEIYGPFNSFDEIYERAQDEETKITQPNGSKRVGVTKAHVEPLRSLAELTDTELIEAEEKYLGVALSDNSATILEDYAEEIQRDCVPISNTESIGEHIVAGIIINIEEKITKNGNPYMRVTISDEHDSLTFSVWSGEMRRLAFMWRRRTAGVFHLKRDARGIVLVEAKALYARTKK